MRVDAEKVLAQVSKRDLKDFWTAMADVDAAVSFILENNTHDQNGVNNNVVESLPVLQEAMARASAVIPNLMPDESDPNLVAAERK